MFATNKPWPVNSTHDPHMLATQHYVLLRQARNPYRPGTREHAEYTEAYEAAADMLPTLSELHTREQERILENRAKLAKRARAQRAYRAALNRRKHKNR